MEPRGVEIKGQNGSRLVGNRPVLSGSGLSEPENRSAGFLV
jgi:hypothetical protein